jgi:hypothetical protein
LTNEKTTKAKIKTFETKIKDFKASSSSNTNAEEKHKFKIASLEKTIEFLKLKTQDLEKKFTLEQEAKNNLTKKNEKLTQKVTTLEKSLHEAQQKSLMASTEKKEKEDELNAYLGSTHEKPLEVLDLNASHKQVIDENEEGGCCSDDEDEKLQQSGPAKEEKPSVTKKTSKVLTFENSQTEPAKKKVVSKTGSEDVRVLLNVIHNMVTSIKSTVPVITQTNAGRPTATPQDRQSYGSPSKGGSPSLSLEEKSCDLGEIFFPCFNNLVGNLTELLPMLSKPYNIKHIFTVVELYYRLLNFFFKFKVQKRF